MHIHKVGTRVFKIKARVSTAFEKAKRTFVVNAESEAQAKLIFNCVLLPAIKDIKTKSDYDSFIEGHEKLLTQHA